MKILVLMKISGGEVNPFDESALECALRLSDDVTVLSMAPESAVDVLQPLTRLGAKAILVSDKTYAGSDTLATAYILSEAVKQQDYDLIICGRQSVDGDTGQVGPMLSAMLEYPIITEAIEVAVNGDTVTAETRHGCEAALIPAIVSVEKGYILRFPSIFSKVGEVRVIDNSAIGCDPARCGLGGSPTRVIKTFENQNGRRKCRYIGIEELKPLISELLQKKADDKPIPEDGEKLSEVWAVGEETYDYALTVAKRVKLIEKINANEIVHLAREEKPEVILWSGDSWGRKNAALAAAKLDTGLCADCTELSVEDGRLIMYRPAKGGSIYAKIACLTTPQMATVRTASYGADILLSCGKGAAGCLDDMRELAENLGAELTASRGLVDTGAIPYTAQVGLSGRKVSPKIYIAVGISGAAYHTCAIEGAGTVIAVNPDKDARIFDYADYGIVCRAEDLKILSNDTIPLK